MITIINFKVFIMKKQFLNALLCGAMIFSTGNLTSCSDDNDDLENRVTVIEGMIKDLQSQLGNALTSGASVISATKADDGTWTLVLSNEQTIVIQPGSGGVTVVENETNIIITVNGKEYVLPKGSSIGSLIYSPATIDGVVELDNADITVKFLVRPVLTAEELAKATFEIAEAHQVTRAAYEELFIAKSAKLGSDGLIEVVFAGGDALAADKNYAVALQMSYSGAVISSNYFIVHVSDNYSSGTEELIPNLGFAFEVTDANKQENGSYTATLPAAKADFLGSFNFKDLLQLPEGENYEFTLGKKDEQNEKAQERYDFFKGCLAADGTWTMTARPGTNCPGDDAKPGILIIVKVGKVTKAKVYWKVIDPLADVDFTSSLSGLTDQHMEYGEKPAEGTNEGEGIILNSGVNKLNLMEVFTKDKLSLKHGKTIEFQEALKEYSVSVNNQEFIYCDGSKFVLSDEAKKYMKFSIGLKWVNKQTSIAASQRRNWNMTDDEKKAFARSECNGEIIGGWDGLPEEDMNAKGLKITDDGFFETTEAYGGWGLRVGMGVQFQYDYGTKDLHKGCLSFLWINRRKCAEGVIDPASK